jgi:hypothetical protein
MDQVLQGILSGVSGRDPATSSQCSGAGMALCMLAPVLQSLSRDVLALLQ